jgi:aryl-alcohol dehydrogenase-like predicted oxidoreductase
METRKIGSLAVSVIGLGTNNFGLLMDEPDVAPVVDAALQSGINFFDTSDSYGESERRLGRALGRRRDEVVLATKFGTPLEADAEGGARPAYIRRAVERSLKELGTDRIDLYQLHAPDPKTPIADTLAALDELVVAGKVREIGISKFSADQIRAADEAVRAGAARFVSVQNELNLLRQADMDEVLPLCRELSIAYIPFWPLASGMLTGKYQRGAPVPAGTRFSIWQEQGKRTLVDTNFDVVERLTQWSVERGHSLAELAMAWLISKPVASVIAGATSAGQVRQNASVNWSLTQQEVAEVESLTGRSTERSASAT